MYTPLYCNPLLITKIITQYPKRGLGGSRAGLRLIPPIPLNWAPRPKAAVPNRSIAIDWSIARPRPVDREMFGPPPHSREAPLPTSSVVATSPGWAEVLPAVSRHFRGSGSALAALPHHSSVACRARGRGCWPRRRSAAPAASMQHRDRRTQEG